MTAKRYLSQLALLNRRIANKQRQIDDLEARLTATGGTDYSRDRVKSSLPMDPMADRIAHLVDLRAELDRQIDRYIDTRARITDQINGMEDSRHVAILGMRYLEELTLTQIAEKMNYEYKWCCRLHGQALIAFGKRYLTKE